MFIKFASGAHKRKLLSEKELCEKELLEMIPELTGFFKPNVRKEGESSGVEGAIHGSSTGDDSDGWVTSPICRPWGHRAW